MGKKLVKSEAGRRVFLKSFYVAGFTYYQGALVFSRLQIGKKLRLLPEPENQYDQNAVAIYCKKHKIGYIPKKENSEIAALLQVGFRHFEVVVQQVSPDEHPERQLRVGVFLKSRRKGKRNKSIRNNS